MTDLSFYFLIDCPKCDEDIYYGPCITLLEHNQRMVIPVDMVEQSRVDCEACGTTVFLGDLDYFYEYTNEDAEPAEQAG